MQLEIAPQHHLFIIGRSGMNIKQIMQRTGANIHFPDPTTSTPQRKGTIYITGNIESVFQARQHLIVSEREDVWFVKLILGPLICCFYVKGFILAHI